MVGRNTPLPNYKNGVTLFSLNMCDAVELGAGMFQTVRVLTPGLTVESRSKAEKEVE